MKFVTAQNCPIRHLDNTKKNCGCQETKKRLIDKKMYKQTENLENVRRKISQKTKKKSLAYNKKKRRKNKRKQTLW